MNKLWLPVHRVQYDFTNENIIASQDVTENIHRGTTTCESFKFHSYTPSIDHLNSVRMKLYEMQLWYGRGWTFINYPQLRITNT